MSINPSKNVLLLGAGFSHNFGIPLASDIWNEIFTRKTGQTDRIRKVMLENQDCDFEQVYSEIVNGDYTEEEKECIHNAIRDTFKGIDETIRNWTNNAVSPNALNIYALQNFLSLFAQENGYIFTLNQDLLLERLYYNGPKPMLPGIDAKSNWFSTGFRQPLQEYDYCKLPDQTHVDQLKDSQVFEKGFHYIKLHGSQNWLDSNGNMKLVIGKNKPTDISNEPLLSLYADVFKQVLTNENIELFVIGYSFRDPHINEAIANSVKFGLKLHILSPMPTRTVLSEIRSNDPKYGEEIVSSLMGPYKCTLNELFPADQSNTQMWSQIRENYFHGNALIKL
jgi:hypothetical protein